MDEPYHIHRARIQSRAPGIDLRDLDALVEQNPFGNSTNYLIDNVFHNGLTFGTTDYPDVQQKRYALGIYYFGTVELKARDEVLKVLNYATGICERLLNPNASASRMGASPIYHIVAHEIMDFYAQHKDDPASLASWEKALSDDLQMLCMPWSDQQFFLTRDPNRFNRIKEVAGTPELTEDVLSNPQLVLKIWELAKAQYPVK
ncbi:MAG TPA: hypothetical protein VJH97_01795 [Candidatus Nanoarchaeia archaeon]|nr:hypothetical protein [Candidatus Nanoarchaeia archaeon]